MNYFFIIILLCFFILFKFQESFIIISSQNFKKISTSSVNLPNITINPDTFCKNIISSYKSKINPTLICDNEYTLNKSENVCLSIKSIKPTINNRGTYNRCKTEYDRLYKNFCYKIKIPNYSCPNNYILCNDKCYN